jgi:hypothetical protein
MASRSAKRRRSDLTDERISVFLDGMSAGAPLVDVLGPLRSPTPIVGWDVALRFMLLLFNALRKGRWRGPLHVGFPVQLSYSDASACRR